MSLLQALQLPRPRKMPAPAPAAGAAAPDGGALTGAAGAWLATRRQARERIDALKRAVKARCADAAPALVPQLDPGLARLDKVLETIDERLAQALTNAADAADPAARDAGLEAARSILEGYTNAVKGEPLVAHIDANPFDVKTDLRALLSAGLAQARQAIG